MKRRRVIGKSCRSWLPPGVSPKELVEFMRPSPAKMPFTTPSHAGFGIEIDQNEDRIVITVSRCTSSPGAPALMPNLRDIGASVMIVGFDGGATMGSDVPKGPVPVVLYKTPRLTWSVASPVCLSEAGMSRVPRMGVKDNKPTPRRRPRAA